jgi:hypothetical protein
VSNIYVGMDVHQASITLAVLPARAPAPTRVDQLPNDLPKLRRYLNRLAEGGWPCPDFVDTQLGGLGQVYTWHPVRDGTRNKLQRPPLIGE